LIRRGIKRKKSKTNESL